MQSVFVKYLILLISIQTVFGASSSPGCPLETWQCNNGQCIQSENLCDGQYDCKDKSDETIEECLQLPCVTYSFKCSYGACIAGAHKCNAVVDCVDGSDEAKSHSDEKSIASPTLQSSERCVIPDLPQMEQLVIRKHPLNETINVGTILDNSETIHIECKDSTNADVKWDLICLNGQFNHDFPSCTCDGSYLRRLSLRTSCPDEKDCSDRVPFGTTVEVRCAYGYTRIPNDVQYLKCLENGRFDKRPISCKQECGKLAHNAVPLSKDGIQIDVSYAPWHVAIFEHITANAYIYICSGSIVSQRIILSAAHCFWDEANSKIKTVVGFQIIAGRSTSNYTTEQSERSQIVKVERIHVPQDFQGRRELHKGDIAILKLEFPLKYSPTIAPLCLPENLDNMSAYITSNLKGFTSVFDSHNQLDVLHMTTLSYHECTAVAVGVPVADDKFCIHNSENITVSVGNSGAPFYVAEGIGSKRTFVFIGIISHIVTSGTSEYIIPLTNIYYVDAKFRIELERAIKDDEKLF